MGGSLRLLVWALINCRLGNSTPSQQYLRFFGHFFVNLRLSKLPPCFCCPVSKVASVRFADTSVVSSLISLKDEKMKEDAEREHPPDTLGVKLGPLFL